MKIRIWLAGTVVMVFLAAYRGELTSQKRKIVLIFRSSGSEEELKLTKDQQKELKDYCKSKQVTLTSKDASYNELKKKQSEIMLILYQPGGDLEEKKEQVKKEMALMPEIARFITLTFYGSTSNPDSTKLHVYSFPSTLKENVSFFKNINHHKGTDIVTCIKGSLDSCIANGYLN